MLAVVGQFLAGLALFFFGVYLQNEALRDPEAALDLAEREERRFWPACPLTRS